MGRYISKVEDKVYEMANCDWVAGSDVGLIFKLIMLKVFTK